MHLLMHGGWKSSTHVNSVSKASLIALLFSIKPSCKSRMQSSVLWAEDIGSEYALSILSPELQKFDFTETCGNWLQDERTFFANISQSPRFCPIEPFGSLLLDLHLRLHPRRELSIELQSLKDSVSSWSPSMHYMTISWWPSLAAYLH